MATRQRSNDGDAAHWNHSPEWWGTQDGGWGRNAGTTVFRQQSQHGNGEASPASLDFTNDALKLINEQPCMPAICSLASSVRASGIIARLQANLFQRQHPVVCHWCRLW